MNNSRILGSTYLKTYWLVEEKLIASTLKTDQPPEILLPCVLSSHLTVMRFAWGTGAMFLETGAMLHDWWSILTQFVVLSAENRKMLIDLILF